MFRLVAAWLIVNGLLMAPMWLGWRLGVGPKAGWIALEAALIVGFLAFLPRTRWTRILSYTAAGVMVLVTLIAMSDLVFQVALARPLNLAIDLYLLSAVYNLAVGNSGLWMTIALALGLVLVVTLLTYGLGRLMEPGVRGAGADRLAPRAAGLALVALFAAGWALTDQVTFEVRNDIPPPERGTFISPTGQLVRTQARFFRDTRVARREFEAEMARIPDSYQNVPGLLSKLQRKDVLLTFIESYGMAVLDEPDMKAVIGPRLDTMNARMEAAGIHLVTGAFVSATQGGQSWYAHGTTLSGLWLETELRYDMFMATDRETMVDDFRRAGYHTSAVMPAITMTWPDGERLGFDDLYTEPNIPYEGPPIFWVTMPDQFTWSFLQNDVRPLANGKPLFAFTGLVSSHAPWTPILPVLPWDSIGNGKIFERYRAEGHPPETLWMDIAKLRSGYVRDIEYTLEITTEFAERYLDDRTLLIVLGDHQAAPWVTGGKGRRVPVHVMSRDPALLQPFLEWGFVPGAFPDPAARAPRMDEFRDWFVRSYSDGDAERN